MKFQYIFQNDLRHDCECALHKLQELIYNVSDAVQRCDENMSHDRSELHHLFTLLSEELRCKKKAFKAVEFDFDKPYNENLHQLRQLRDWICGLAHDLPAGINEPILEGKEGTAWPK